MKTFKTRQDLRRLSPEHPAYPVIDELVRVIIDADPDYNAEDHGYIVLIEEGDQDRYLTEIGWDDHRLIDLPYEGITLQQDHYVAIVLCNNEYGLVFVFSTALVSGDLAEVIHDYLDPPFRDQTGKTQ